MAPRTQLDEMTRDEVGDRDERRERCAFCRRALPPQAGVGRPRSYCRRSCRQRAFEQRRRAAELSWGDERLVGLREQVAGYGDLLAGVRDVVAELRIDVADGVPVDVEEALARVDAALRPENSAETPS